MRSKIESVESVFKPVKLEIYLDSQKDVDCFLALVKDIEDAEEDPLSKDANIVWGHIHKLAKDLK